MRPVQAVAGSSSTPQCLPHPSVVRPVQAPLTHVSPLLSTFFSVIGYRTLVLSTGFREKTPFLVTEQLKGSVPARAQANQVFPPALTKRQKSFFTPWP